MHPEMLRELATQRGHEMRARARQAKLARMAIRVGRRRRSGPDETDQFVLPAVPDYVDGSFRTEPAGEAADSGAGKAPAAHHAA
jgi:hypothetical protein